MKKKDTNPMELSYYRLNLLSFLKESHPTLATDTDFIRSRADEASEAYSDAVKDGLSHIEAEELANLLTLFRGLLFPDTILSSMCCGTNFLILFRKVKRKTMQKRNCSPYANLSSHSTYFLMFSPMSLCILSRV